MINNITIKWTCKKRNISHQVISFHIQSNNASQNNNNNICTYKLECGVNQDTRAKRGTALAIKNKYHDKRLLMGIILVTAC